MKIDNEIGSRIQILIDKEGIPLQSFACEIGITPGGLNHILNGRNKPRFDLIQKIIEKYKNLNLDWFFFGKLPIYKEDKNILSVDFLNGKTTNLQAETVGKSQLISKNKSKNMFIEDGLSLSDNIDEIRIYLKNKTYLVFKLEK